MSDHKFFLKRSDSITSLASLGPDRRHSKKPAQGAIKLDVQFEAPTTLKAKKKTSGTLHVVVKEAAGLSTKEPYIKLYLSERNKDLKGTKQKTKPSKKGVDPLYEERFAYYLKPSMTLSETRLQVTLWDRSTLSSNMCIGGMSFAIDDIRNGALQGWFQMLPEVEGRHRHELVTASDELAPHQLAQSISSAAERGSSDSLASVGADGGKKKKSFRGGLGMLVRGKKGRQEAAETRLAQDTIPASVLAAEDNFESEASAFDRFAAPVGKTASSDSLDNVDESAGRVDIQREESPEPERRTAVANSVGESSTDPPAREVKRYSVQDYNDNDDNDQAVDLSAAMATPAAADNFDNDDDDADDDAWADTLELTPEEPAPAPQIHESPPLSSVPEPESEPEPEPEVAAAPAPISRTLPEPGMVDRLPAPAPLRKSGSSDSITSLMSVAADMVVSSADVSGELNLSMEYVEASGRKAPGVKVLVIDTSLFKAKSPYLKLYVSRNGVDVKTTKTKSKPGKAGKLPLPLELTVSLPKDVNSKPGSYRLQLSIWDHARMKANECLGGMSFSLSDIMETARVEGYFELLPFQRGRCDNSKLSPPDRRSDVSYNSNSMASSAGSMPSAVPAQAVRSEPSAAASLATAALARAVSPVNSTGSNDTGVSMMENKAPGLKRSGSNGSLVSVASGLVVQSINVQGSINVNIWFEPADENDVKYLGWLNITINEAQNLASPDTYVKLYLLFRGKSVRSSKMKTKVVKKSKDPIFEQKLRMPVTRTQSLGADTALELSVWDHSRLKANEVLGSVLFTVEDIASTTTTSGWFDLNNYNDGRKQLSTTGGTASRRASSGVGVAAAVGSGATRLAHMEAVKSASREDVSQFEQFSADSEVDAGKGRKKRTLPIGKTSKAQLNVQIEELRQQVRRLQAAEERHIQEKGLLEEKLQSVRDSTGTSSNLKKKNAEMMQELDDLRARTAGATELHERVETLEDDNLRLTQQLKLLNGDRARHTEEISGLRDRQSDLTTEIRGLRAWKEVLADALLKINPAALTQATVAIANSMN